MGKYAKILNRIMRGTSDANIAFFDLCRLLIKLDFIERVRGDHHIFARQDIDEILNLQPRGAKAKPYQVKQVRDLILKYRLDLEEDNEK